LHGKNRVVEYSGSSLRLVAEKAQKIKVETLVEPLTGWGNTFGFIPLD
jgi:hypothetical protein